MKTINLKLMLFAAGLAAVTAACTKDGDFEVQNFTPVAYAEDFNKNAADNTILDTPGWINYNEAGNVKWKEQIYSHNAYAEFTSFQSGDLTNIGWLISPAYNMDLHEHEKLVFESAMAYVTSGANSLEVLISSDFDDTNPNVGAAVAAANWQHLDATIPGTNSTYFEFINSGQIDLSAYTGNIHIAFKVKGSGTNTALDGSYQIDAIRITY